MADIRVNTTNLTLIRRALTVASREAYREQMNRLDIGVDEAKRQALLAAEPYDNLLDALPEPVDEVVLRHPDPHEAAALMDEYHAERMGR